MKVLITGANGFIGSNLQLHLAERKQVHVVCFTRSDDVTLLPSFLKGVDFVFHLAGVNRPQDPREFISGNLDLTKTLCQAVVALAESTGKRVPIIYTSSTQAVYDTPYGDSKRKAEDAVFAVLQRYQVPVHVFRLTNVFGKWGKPNYNSAVATFCFNISRGLPIKVNDPAVPITLVYVDDLIKRFLQILDGVDSETGATGFSTITPQYTTTVGELVSQFQAFKDSRFTLMTKPVGTGLMRALYATYVSYLPVESFSYAVPQYSDARGVFCEFLKTPDCGQFSFFTAHPGITRGGHYHQSKTEKFLVIKGQARFKFQNMQNGQRHELVTTGEKAEVVETVPGWTHDITNIGDNELVVLLWTNEVFDRDHPDTFTFPL